ncbi:MAG TPA: LamG domain-containing protein [Candidatus Aquilonibacter sp.]|nr:LamG domain-containing protein [Candidatus Aquilonibacter sp.]
MPQSRGRLFAIACVAVLAGCSAGGGSGSPVPVSQAVTVVSPAATATVKPMTLSTAVSVDSPLAYYHLDDTGSVAADASGHGLNGAVGTSVAENATGLVTSSTDSAMSFPGLQSASGVVNVAGTSKLQPSNASLEALVRFSATPADYTIVAGYGKSSGSGTYEMYFKSGHVVAQFTTNNGLANVVSPSALVAGKIYQLDATYDGKTASLYVNGALAASVARSGWLVYGSGAGFAIAGSYSSVNPGYKGVVDEVSVYAYSLSATRVAAHYAAAITTATPTPAPTATPTATPTAKPTVAPTPTPTVAPTATPLPATIAGATYAGCPVFTAGDYYNNNISSASIDPNSAAYIKAVYSTGDTGGFYASTGVEKVNLASASTPLYTVKQQVSYHSFPVAYPWLSSYFIEPLSDKHSMVVQNASCHLYEAYGTTFSNNVLSAYSGANWDLTKPFAPLPAGQPSAMASGLSLFAGAVKWEDYQSGTIRHALNWGGVAHTVAQYKFVLPASDTDQLAFNGGSLPQLPYGAHLRLKASFSTAGWGPEATAVAQAMKTYGIYLADTGSSGNALYFTNAPDGSNPWNGSDLSALGKIHITDFDVLTLPPVQTVPGH